MLTLARRDDTQPYIPPTKPYELSVLTRDLVLLARYLLKPRGRLVMFIPTVTEDYHELDVQSMLCEGMELIANSLQDFGSWGRRVNVTTVRRRSSDSNTPSSNSSSRYAKRQHQSTHRLPLRSQIQSITSMMPISQPTKISARNTFKDSKNLT